MFFFSKECDEKDDYSPVKEDCSKFLRCAHGKFVEFQCAPGTLWDYIRKLCDNPEKTACFNGQTLETCNDGIYGVHGNCTQYKVCKNNEFTYERCDSNLLFDYITMECINPSDAKCLPSVEPIDTDLKSYTLFNIYFNKILYAKHTFLRVPAKGRLHWCHWRLFQISTMR